MIVYVYVYVYAYVKVYVYTLATFCKDGNVFTDCAHGWDVTSTENSLLGKQALNFGGENFCMCICMKNMCILLFLLRHISNHEVPSGKLT